MGLNVVVKPRFVNDKDTTQDVNAELEESSGQ